MINKGLKIFFFWLKMEFWSRKKKKMGLGFQFQLSLIFDKDHRVWFGLIRFSLNRTEYSVHSNLDHVKLVNQDSSSAEDRKKLKHAEEEAVDIVNEVRSKRQRNEDRNDCEFWRAGASVSSGGS